MLWQNVNYIHEEKYYAYRKNRHNKDKALGKKRKMGLKYNNFYIISLIKSFGKSHIVTKYNIYQTRNLNQQIFDLKPDWFFD